MVIKMEALKAFVLHGTDSKYHIVVTPKGNNGHFISSRETLEEVKEYCNLVGEKGDAVKITNKFNGQVKELVVGE